MARSEVRIESLAPHSWIDPPAVGTFETIQDADAFGNREAWSSEDDLDVRRAGRKCEIVRVAMESATGLDCRDFDRGYCPIAPEMVRVDPCRPGAVREPDAPIASFRQGSYRI